MIHWPRISAIVANWNGARDLEQCLPSVVGQDYPGLDVTVVDNGSTDSSQVVVEQVGARWLPLGQNLGLAGALNAGARMAEGEFLLFLNNDLRLKEDFVRRLAQPLIEDSTIFAADGLQWDWDGRVRVHGRTRVAAGRPFGLPVLEQDYPAQITHTFMASAANALVRRTMFEDLGGWDPIYFIGWEDVDLFWRAWQRGWRSVFVPDAICWHRVGASAVTAEGSRIRLRGTLEGRLYFASKCLPAVNLLGVWITTCGGLVRDVVSGKWNTAREKAIAMRRAVCLLKQALRSRREIYRSGPNPETHLRFLVRLGT